ncbi:hypothetical protein AX16_004978 [Volvariella volvacea WC 439]|nr:hypothetical protein AX16_004978 [Volvariella volvacea WC 439]
MQRILVPLGRCSIRARHPLPIRRTSASLASAAFTSYFFHNGQWLRSQTTTTPIGSAHNASVWGPSTHGDIAAPKPPPSAFKEVQAFTPKRLVKVYAQLAKSRLTVLVVLTAMSGVALSPLSASIPILLSTAIGTTLCSASANAFNQLQEIPFDAQMARTRMRPLVRRAITPFHAAAFATVTGIAGPAILWTMVNPITAVLGLGNIALYAGVYTWSKRRSIWNTWIGAVVGALPPLMGWTACGGHLLPSAEHPVHMFWPSFLSHTPQMLDLSLVNNPLSPFAFFMLLFSWQFPHFNSLSYIVRGSYAQAGYRMLSVLDPAKNTLVSLRHSVVLGAVCSVLFPLSGLTTWTFALTSALPNAICIRAAWKFWKRGGEKQARSVFQHSLWYLPVVMGLMMIHKQGVDWWQWLGLRDSNEVETAPNEINAEEK